MSINIWLSVKFRAFFIDFAKFEKGFRVVVTPAGPAWEEIPAIDPVARKVLDKSGVKLWVW